MQQEMPVIRPRTRRIFVIGLLLLLALQLFHLSRATSSTWDEPHHLFDGYNIWKHHDYGLNPEVPPLLKLIAAAPLLRARLDVPPLHGWPIPAEAFLGGRNLVFDNGGDRVLFPARMACAAVTLLLGGLLYLVGAEMFGSLAGLIALAFFVFDPNFLANGALVTTDIASSITLLAAIYAWYRYCKVPTWNRLVLTGLAAGLALVAKFTGILVFPMLGLLALLEGIRLRSGRKTAHLLAAFAGVSAISLVVLWSFYGFRYSARPNGLQLNPTFTDSLKWLPNPADARHLTLLARGHILPEAYIWGLGNTRITEFQDTSYFFGHVYRHGRWEYFPAAFLIKSTLPFLLLVLLAAIILIAKRWRTVPQRELLFLLVPVAIYLAVAMSSKLNIGVRHLLPIYGFLYVLAAGAAAQLSQKSRRWTIAIAVLLLWQAVTSARVAPGYMAYANEIWGGPSQTHRYLGDANVDWAQQLKATKLYLDQRHITQCWIAYFADGAILPSDYGIPCKRLPTTASLWWLKLPMDIPAAIDGPILISESDLEGIEFGQGRLNPYEQFRNMSPTASIQYGLNVYDGHFNIPLASALYHAQQSENLLATNQIEAAANEAAQAISLAPQSVQVQTAEADVLLRQHRDAEALTHYQAALTAAQTIEPELQTGPLPSLEAQIKALSQSPAAGK
jgi:4-amino-4-deoxy-L-arabinose transferase-like glycosyltransferase